MSHNMPELGAESNGFDTEIFLEERSEKMSERLYFYPLPNYHQDRRFDPRARGELSGMLPNSDDYTAKVKKIMAPGWYAVELRRGSKIADSWALEIKPDERRIDPDAPASSGLTAEVVAKVVTDALERQRAEFAQAVAALRDELKPQTTTQEKTTPTLTEELHKAVTLLRELRELNGEINPQPPRAEERRRSPEEELTLAIASQSDLLPTVIESVAGALNMARGGATSEQDLFDRAVGVFKGSPALQQRAIKTWDRVLNRILPDNEAGEDDYDALSSEQRQGLLINYLLTKCAANEPVSFDDEEIVRFRDAEPDVWTVLLDSLRASSIKLIVEHFGGMSPIYAAVLKQKHAPAWITANLKKPAAELLRKDNE